MKTLFVQIPLLRNWIWSRRIVLFGVVYKLRDDGGYIMDLTALSEMSVLVRDNQFVSQLTGMLQSLK